MGNPWIFKPGNAKLPRRAIPALTPIGERSRYALRLFTLACEMKDEYIACLEARKHYAGISRASPMRLFKTEITKKKTMANIKNNKTD
jgi:tRNA-dihydrouridine synthase B